MRGILIDPFTRTVTEVETEGNLAAIYELLGVAYVTVVPISGDQAIFIDDEGLLVEKEHQEYWQWAGSNQPYAGKGLVLGGDEEGDNVDATSTLEEIAGLVTFLEKADVDPEEFTGITIITW
jgi:hypothetical protein